MSLSVVKGQDHAARCLNRALETGRVGNAYFLFGPPGVGKRTAARALASALACENPPSPGETCGGCEPCRQILKDVYPDLKVIGPEDEGSERGRSFHVDTIKETMSWAARTAYRHRWKVCILESVHSMSFEAANSFLKMLEEPPPKTVWILLSSEPRAVLTTIQSRCQPVRFGLLGRAAAAGIARERGASEEQADVVAQMGMIPQDLAENVEWTRQAGEVIRMATRFDLPGLCTLARDYSRKEEKEKIPYLLEGLEHECGRSLRAERDLPDRWIVALDAVVRARRRYVDHMDKTLLDALGAELSLALYRSPRA